MVGRKTSQRCETCRKRKIKCDLAQPACTPCQKAGWDCPGYDSHAVFHQHVVAPTSVERGAQVRQHRTPPCTLSIIHEIPMSATDKLRSELVTKGQSGQLSARFVVIPEYRIMEHLPCRLGENRALDDAVRLICTSNQTGSLRAYGVSLRSLQHSINHGISAEALGAATLLQMHDFFQNASYQTWAVHAMGVINMLKARGPEAIKTSFDKSLLQAQLGNISMAALQGRQPCFLSGPGWREKVRLLGAEKNAAGQTYGWEMSLIAVGVDIPGLLCRFEALDSDGVRPYDPGLQADLRTCRQELDRNLQRTPDDALQAEEGTNRIRPALLLAANFYVIILDHMISVTGRRDNDALNHEEGSCHNASLADDSQSTVTLSTLGNLYGRLREADAVALQGTAHMLSMTLERVLDATYDGRTSATKDPSSTLLDGIMHVLSSASPNCCKSQPSIKGELFEASSCGHYIE